MMEQLLESWMLDNPTIAAIATLALVIAGAFWKLSSIGNRVAAAKRESDDTANDHHNDMIASNRSEEAQLNQARLSVDEWAKRVRGGK